MRGGVTTDLVKDFSSSAISSMASVFEPVEVYASEQEVTMGDIIVRFDTSTGTITGYVSGEGALNIPEKINGVTVNSIGENAFKGCYNLHSVDISNSVTLIEERAFYNCHKLTTVNIPNSVTSIGSYAFYECDNLMSVNIGANVSYIGHYVFFNCENLTNINVDSANSVYTSKDGILFTKYITGLICYPAGKKDSSYIIPDTVAFIEAGAFSYCSSLTYVNIPDSVTSIGSYAFRGCSSLISVNIPDGVTSINKFTFNNCNSLISVNIPNSINSIGEYAFSGCNNLISVSIPNSVTSIGEHAFYSCDNLTYINVDSNNSNYTSKDGVLFSKNMNLLICYPSSKKDSSYVIPDSVTEISSNAFHGCSNLESVNIPNSVTELGYGAFMDSSSLKTITMSNGITSIGSSTFWGCTGLTSINIPNSITLIGESAFFGCSSLTSVSIPNSVTSIVGGVFYMCYNLKDVYYEGSEANWNKIDIDESILSSTNSEHVLYQIQGDYANKYLFDATIHYNSTMPSTGSSSPSKQPPSAPKVDGINFKIGQTTSVMDVAPYVENGNTMIPVRAMANLLGISDDNITYDDATKKVTITYYERVISLTIGDNKLYVTENGSTSTKTMDNNATAVTKDWRTFVPVRALSEAFGLQVGWDNNTQTVTLSS